MRGSAVDSPAVRSPVTGLGVSKPGERILEVFARAKRPDDPLELRDLYLGQVDNELGPGDRASLRAERWRESRRRRDVQPSDVLTSRAAVRFVKELFNAFFRDDLYGRLRSPDHLILSSGSVEETLFGLPEVAKDCVRFALDRDWYGYSDSRGRGPARAAVAELENHRLGAAVYSERNVALTMGGTFAIAGIADFLALETRPAAPALCALPNYAPLVESVARRMDVELVPLACGPSGTDLDPLLAALRPSTPLILLQTVTNPTGTAISEAALERVVAAASPSTTIVLDECHECLGPHASLGPARAAANVVRISSMSKNWAVPGMKIGWLVADAAFVDGYYEYASTTFGGPPSFFYTLVEVLARFERWLLDGVERAAPGHLNEFERSYGWTAQRLDQAYGQYAQARRTRERALIELREATVAHLLAGGLPVLPPTHSINLATAVPGIADSYVAFRRVLDATGVAVFPGILTFCLGDPVVRLTTSRAPAEVGEATERLAAFARGRNA